MDGSSALAGRLRRLILADVSITLGAATLSFAINVAIVHSPYLYLLASLVVGTAGLMAIGLRPLRYGDCRRSLAWVAVANWGIAIVASTIATFTWPLMMQTALLPAVLAISVLSGRELGAALATSTVVAMGVVILGLLQDVTGFSPSVDEWVRDLVLILTAPGLVGLVAMLAWQNSSSLQQALASMSASREALAKQAEELRRSRARVVAAGDRERRRIERDLHDGAQQWLVGIDLGLARAGRHPAVGHDPELAALVADLRRSAHLAHQEIRRLAHGVYPPALTEHGLEAALAEAADRCPIPVRVRFAGVGRCVPDVESALYFSCVEAMQNAAKHAAASSVTLSSGVAGREVWVAVGDDGIGFDPTLADPDGGLMTLRDRLGAIGGCLAVESAPGVGTVVEVRGPV
ncbi:sensor histidine kinase [Desertimonas flava]|uniref:sensor histidine kinase n=1 Tax=Desertimonas flava TaxID=2064846 RepID=UPI000E34EB82|nr:histidine kinase [Desertimonas flava]